MKRKMEKEKEGYLEEKFCLGLRYKVKEALATLAIAVVVVTALGWPMILATIGVILWDWPWWAIFLSILANAGWIVVLYMVRGLIEP